jgi:Rha family phage regulatory protein
MNELVPVEADFEHDVNGRPVVDSRKVAERFKKQHKHVLRDIDNLIERGAPQSNFGPGSFTHPDTGAQEHRCFKINRDGFTLLAMGFTGDEALRWKLAYIELFNRMEAALTTPPQLITPDSLRQIAAAMEQANARALAAERHAAEINERGREDYRLREEINIPRDKRLVELGRYERVTRLFTGEAAEGRFTIAETAKRLNDYSQYAYHLDASHVSRIIGEGAPDLKCRSGQFIIPYLGWVRDVHSRFGPRIHIPDRYKGFVLVVGHPGFGAPTELRTTYAGIGELTRWLDENTDALLAERDCF